MFDPPVIRFIFFCILMLGSCGYAIWRGGAPERITGWLLIGATVLSFAVGRPAHYGHLEVGVFVIDVALLIALVIVALKADRMWPIALAALHLDSTAAHILKLFDAEVIRVTYAVMIIMWAYPMQVILAIGTLRHQRRLACFGEDRAWSLAVDMKGGFADVARIESVAPSTRGPWGALTGDSRAERGQD